MAKNDELSSKQKRMIDAMLTSRTLGDACKTAQVSRSTLARWLMAEKFKTALAEAEAEVFHEVTWTLMAGLKTAFNVLNILMLTSKHDAVRRQSAVDWISSMQKFHEIYGLEERISKLEVEAINAREKSN